MSNHSLTSAATIASSLNQVSISTVHNTTMAVGVAGVRTITIDLPQDEGGQGLGFSGGELLLLAIGSCYCNDLHRAAARSGISLDSIDLTVSAKWSDKPLQLTDAHVSIRTKTAKCAVDLHQLIKQVDVATSVANSLRSGARITLAVAD